MKKRICSLLLSCALVLSLLPAGALAAESPWTAVENESGMAVTTAPEAKNWSLTIQASATGLGGDTANVYAVVIPTETYEAKGTSFLTTINATNYADAAKLGLTAGTHRATQTTYTPSQTLPALTVSLPSFTLTKTIYHKQYTYILFSSAKEAGKAEHYLVGTFWVDSKGNTGTRDTSYLLRYNGNSTSVGSGQSVTGTPGYVITKPETADTPLTFTGIFRTGYTFLGWDANKDLMGTDPNAAADSETKPIYQTGGTTAFSGADRTANTIYDLYAIWKPVKVAFANKIEQLKGAQVGVKFEEKFTLDTTSANATGKTYSVHGGTTLPAGLTVSADGNTGWKISGTPTQDSDGKPVVVTIQVTDNANKTTDTVTITFDQVKKGKPLPPDTTVITGLASDLAGGVQPDEGTEPVAADTTAGRLIGFYAAGQPEQKDAADTKMTDGTGTYTNYYLSKGMIYEYRPKTVGGDNFDTDDSTETEVPWRAIPAPESFYSGLDGDAKTAFTAALAAGSTGDLQTTISGKTATVTVAPVDPWPAAYGAITFDGGIPVVTGLAKDDVYEVRFRANATNDSSDPVAISIGGAAASGSTGPAGYSLVFNLMGGKAVIVKTESSETEGEPPKVTETDVTAELFQNITGLAEGQSVSLPWPELGENETLEFRREGYTFQGFTDGAAGYSHPDQWTYIMPGSCAALSAVWKSAYVDLSGARTVTFLDWDGTTQLAVTAVNQGQGLEAEGYANLMNTLVNDQAGHFEGFAFTPNEANEGYIFNPNRLPSDEAGYIHRPLLTDKGGYTFVGWLPSTADKYHFPKGEVPTEELIDLDSYVVDDYVTLIACYEANSKCGDVNVFNERKYIAYYETISKDGNNYTIEITATRTYDQEVTRFPARMYAPILQITLKSGVVQVVLSATFDNQDIAKAQFTFPNAYSVVSFALADMDGASSAGGATQFSDALIVDSSGATGANYAKIGTMEQINDLSAATAPTATTATSLTAALFNTILDDKVSLAQRRQRTLYSWRVLNGWTGNSAVGVGGTDRGLTVPQLIEAVQGKAGIGNVYLANNIRFTDIDERAGSIGGPFSDLEVITEVADVYAAQIKVQTSVSGWKAYWSSDGITTGNEIELVWQGDVLTIPGGTEKDKSARFILLCGQYEDKIFPASAVVPIWDLSQE